MMKRLLYAMILFWLMACGEESQPNASYHFPRAQIKVSAPEGMGAGREIHLLVDTEDDISRPISLILDNGITLTKHSVMTERKIVMEGYHFTRAGLYQVHALVRGRNIAERKIKITAGEIVGPLEAYTGPTSILVDDRQEAMTVVIPTDGYDNGIMSAPEVSFTKGTTDQIQTEEIDHMLAAFRIRSGKNTKKHIMAVGMGGLGSEEQVVHSIPFWPVDIDLELVYHNDLADNRHYTHIKTTPMKDSNGNPISEGTAVTWKVSQAGALVGRYTSMVVNGTAQVHLRNPSAASNWSVTAQVNNSKSAPLLLDYESLIEALPHSLADGLITVGPLVSRIGQLIPDGTVVTLTHPDGSYSVESADGMVQYDLKSKGWSEDKDMQLTSCGLTIKVDK